MDIEAHWSKIISRVQEGVVPNLDDVGNLKFFSTYQFFSYSKLTFTCYFSRLFPKEVTKLIPMQFTKAFEIIPFFHLFTFLVTLLMDGPKRSERGFE